MQYCLAKAICFFDELLNALLAGLAELADEDVGEVTNKNSTILNGRPRFYDREKELVELEM